MGKKHGFKLGDYLFTYTWTENVRVGILELTTKVLQGSKQQESQFHIQMHLRLKLAVSPPSKAGIKLFNSYIHADFNSEVEL